MIHTKSIMDWMCDGDPCIGGLGRAQGGYYKYKRIVAENVPEREVPEGWTYECKAGRNALVYCPACTEYRQKLRDGTIAPPEPERKEPIEKCLTFGCRLLAADGMRGYCKRCHDERAEGRA